MDKEYADVIDNLRSLRQRKTREKAASWHRRRQALDPVVKFAATLDDAGEIQSAHVDESDSSRPRCILVCKSDQWIIITCESSEREPGRGDELITNLSVEVVGRTKNPFRAHEGSQDADYRKLFHYILEWIAELDSEKEALCAVTRML